MHFPKPRLALVALIAAAVVLIGSLVSYQSQLHANQERGAVPGLTLTSSNPDEITISWEDPDPAPSDYRISWAPVDKGYLSWKDQNELDRGKRLPGRHRPNLHRGQPPDQQGIQGAYARPLQHRRARRQPLERPMDQYRNDIRARTG